jgi:S-adenosylmethionine synthetase
MIMEAAAGKNPISHVGKLYNVAAARVAATIVTEVDAVTDAQCCLVSQIGRQVTDPEIANLQVCTVAGIDVEDVAPTVDEILRKQVSQIGSLWQEIIDGTVDIY